MTLVEAIKSGKRFKRPTWSLWASEIYLGHFFVFKEPASWTARVDTADIDTADILAEDWEIEKTKVTKTISGWVNVYMTGDSYYRTKEQADFNKGILRIACVPVSGTYEVEE